MRPISRESALRFTPRYAAMVLRSKGRLKFFPSRVEYWVRSVMSFSRSVGFESTSYFSQAFKQRYGCSPNELRKRLSQKL